MAPLTALTKVPRNEFLNHCNEKAMAAFNKTKAMIAQDVLLAYLHPNKVFVFDTDVLDYQLGAIRCQDGQPVFIRRQKLTKTKQTVQL